MQAATAVDAVVTQLDRQGTQGPALPCPLGFDLEHRGLTAQAAFQVELGIEFELIAFHFTFAAQWSGQCTGQLGKPVRRVERRELHIDIPRQRVSKAHGNTAGGLALPCGERQLRQLHLGQITFEWAGQRESTRRAVQSAIEGALVITIAVVNLGIETLERDVRRGFQRVQTQPREIQPFKLGIGAQALLPIGAGLQL
ncbi:hypothetical protein D3C81_1042500 [compost metagenome]